jgi:putative endonuclease
MLYYVYILISFTKNKLPITYVGYTKDLKKRLELHNNSKGAKFTRGRKWKIIYKKSYKNKSLAMKNEYLLKVNRSLRNKIKNRFLKK